MKPLFGITYSPPKKGKTLAMLRAFPSGLFFCLPGGLDCASWLGLQPNQIPHKAGLTVDEIIATIKAAGDKFPAIIIDDATLQFDAEYLRIKSKNQSFSGNEQFNRKILELRDVCRDAPVPVFWTMHEQPPREVKKQGDSYGKIIPGTVSVQGWQLPEKLPAMASFVARVVHEDNAINPNWPLVYSTAPDPEYITGSRVDFAIPHKFPLNIGEMLRSVGEEVPRHKDFGWMEKVVEQVSAKMLERPSEIKAVLTETANQLRDKIPNQRYIRWALDDAFDRAQLKRYQAGLLDSYLDNFDNATLE